MNLLEMSKFYGNYEILFEECRHELYEIFDETYPNEKISPCFEDQTLA